MSVFYAPAVNLIGRGVVKEIGSYIKGYGYKKALLVTDHFIAKSGILPKVTAPLDAENIDYVVYSDVDPNPTVKNVEEGLAALKENGCDFIISLGDGSPQDAVSSISILATNGGRPLDYEVVHKSEKTGLPVIAISTTTGTSAEITINYVITDEELMFSMPKSLTTATSLDALTHAIEALVTPGAYAATKKLSVGAIELIKEYLPRAVADGHDLEAREAMVNAIFLGGMAFNNAGLGYVHAMAHQHGAVYHLLHCVCCAMTLPIVERENVKHVLATFRDVAKGLGLHT